MTEAPPPGERLAPVHSGLLVLLIATRPLVWDEDPLSLSVAAYALATTAACGLVLLEAALGWRRLRWGGLAWLAAALILWLGLAAVRTPLPITAWGLWSGAMVNGLLGAYLLQVLPGRRALALAALGAGLAGEALISVLQWPWVLPAMAQAQRSGGLRVVPQALQGSLAERIANGGLFGTFTQANALAAYLLLAVPPLAIASIRARGRTRILGLAIAALAVLAFLGTSSKGSIIAIGAVLLACWVLRAWPGRWLVLALAVIATASALHHPPLRRGLQDSAQVRLGYWQGAWVLCGERPWLGYGLGSFGEQLPRVAPIWASYSSQVHCEPLAAAAESGVPGALLVVALLAALLRSWPRRGAPVAPVLPALALPRWAPWALSGGVLYLEMLGLLDANIGWWPGAGLRYGGFPLIAMAWWVLLAGLMGAALQLLQALPAAPAGRDRARDLGLACRVAVAAVVLHCLIDFDLHAGGVAGTLIVVWLLAQDEPAAAPAAAPPAPRRRLLVAVPALVLGAWLVLLIAVQPTLSRLRAAHLVVDDAQLLTQPGLDRDEALAVLADASDAAGLAMPAPERFVQPQDMKQQLNRSLLTALELATGDRELQTRILTLLPSGGERLPISQRLVVLRPASALVASQLAYDRMAEATQRSADGDGAGAHQAWMQAVAQMRSAIALAPNALALRADFAAMLDAAAAACPDQAADLAREAAQQRAIIAARRDLVDYSNRP